MSFFALCWRSREPPKVAGLLNRKPTSTFKDLPRFLHPGLEGSNRRIQKALDFFSQVRVNRFRDVNICSLLADDLTAVYLARVFVPHA